MDRIRPDDRAQVTSQERYDLLALRFLGHPGVTQKGRGFGGSALKAEGRIFAMLSSRGEFVVKLSAGRAQALIAAGEGTPFETAPGRRMKQWLALAPGASLDWDALAAEALAFVSTTR